MLWPTEDQRSRSSNDVRFRPEADSRGNSKQSYGIIMPTELTRTS